MVNLSLINAGKTGSVVKLTCANTSMVSINFLTVHCDVWYKLGNKRKRTCLQKSGNYHSCKAKQRSRWGYVNNFVM